MLLSAVLHVAVAHMRDNVLFRYASGVDSMALVASGGKFTPDGLYDSG